jgi:DNA-binding NtrC family response regulator
MVELAINYTLPPFPVIKYSEHAINTDKPYLINAMAVHGRNQTKTAKALGINRATLRGKLEACGLSSEGVEL